MKSNRELALLLVLTMLFALFAVANPVAQASATNTYVVTKDTYANGGTDHSAEDTMFVATTTARTAASGGNPETAPKIDGTTYDSGAGNPMGSSRVAFVQYNIPGTTAASDVISATIKMYVTGTHSNLADGFIKVAAYAVSGTAWTENLNNAATIAAAADISDTSLIPSSYASPTAWSDTKITYSGSDTSYIKSGWITFDITDYVKAKLIANASGAQVSTLDLAFRLQVPNGGVYIATKESANASYIEMVTGQRATVTVNYLNANGDAIKAADSSQQEIGTSYTFTNNNQTIIANNKIYSYNPTATGSTTVTVATGGSTINLRYDEVTVSSYTQPQGVTVLNTLPANLPSTLNVVLSDGTSAALPVTWNLNIVDFASIGTVTVTGYVTGATNAVLNALVNVDSAYGGSELIARGATCWFADPRAIRNVNDKTGSDKTYVGAIDTDGTVKAMQYDNKTSVLKQVILDTGFQPDDHDNPTFLVIPDGRVMIFWSQHTAEEKFYYRISKNPDDITDLGERKVVSVTGYGNYTYPSPFYMTDAPNSFFLCWRGVNWHPTIAKYSLPDNNDNISVEINPTQMIQSTGARPYAKYGSNGKDRIYLTYTTGHPDNEYPNWVYYSEIDINTLNLYDANNNLLQNVSTSPYNVNKTSSSGALVVDNPSSYRDWVWDLARDKDGKPVIAMVRISQYQTQHEYYYAKWTGSEWKKTDLANGGKWFHQNPDNLEPSYSGGLALDHANANIIYISVPTAGVYGNVYEIWKYTMDDNGDIVTTEQVTKNSKKNNVRPYIVKDSTEQDTIHLIWMNGDYYYWIVNSSYPLGYPTRMMTNTDKELKIDYSDSFDNTVIPNTVISDLVLPKMTWNGLAITWISSDPNVITNDGAVIRSDSTKTVTLTAQTDYITKTYTVTVPKRGNLAENLLLKYNFEDSSIYTVNGATYVKDTSGNGMDGVLKGSNGKIQNGVLDLTANSNTTFDTNGYLIAPDGVLDGMRSYTFMAKVKMNNTDGQPRIYDFGKDSGNSVFGRAKNLTAGIKYNGGTTLMVNSNTQLTTGVESWVAFTYDAATKTTSVYLNGELTGSGTNITYEAYQNAGNNVNYIGRTQWGNYMDNYDFRGTIDNFSVYNLALTAGEINDMMKDVSAEYDSNTNIVTVKNARSTGAEYIIVVIYDGNRMNEVKRVQVADDINIFALTKTGSVIKVMFWSERVKPVRKAIVLKQAS